jgi:hypothetical protein
MTDLAENLASLSGLYEALAETGLHNLSQIQVLGSMARDLRDGDYKPFVLTGIERALIHGQDVMLIGDIPPDGPFRPSVTERMLHIHRQGDLWNDLIRDPGKIQIGIVSLLQDVVLYAAYVSRIAFYLHSFEGRALAAIDKPKTFADFVTNLPPYMARYVNACLDRTQAAHILNTLKAMDYVLALRPMDGATVHHYPLPADLARTYQAQLERMQETTPKTESCGAQ